MIVTIILIIIAIPIMIWCTKGMIKVQRKQEELLKEYIKKTVREELENQEKEKQEPRQVFHHLTQAEFEKWKAERDKREP